MSTKSSTRDIMPRMKISFLILPFAVVSMALNFTPTLQGDYASFDPVIRALSELPLVGGAVWLVMRLQDRQQQTLISLMSHFETRIKAKDDFYQLLLRDMSQTITELAKRD